MSQPSRWPLVFGAAIGTGIAAATAAAYYCENCSLVKSFFARSKCCQGKEMQHILEIGERLQGRSLASITDLNKEEVSVVMAVAAKCKSRVLAEGTLDLLKSKVVGLIFYEPSTRTRCSFEAAAKRLGSSVVQLLDPSKSSAVKGETFHDTVKMMASYCDALVIRHPATGILDVVREATIIPFLNAGDGSGEHPTQSLLDIFTILSFYPSMEDYNEKPLTVTFVGDLLYGRTVHSLSRLLTLYNVNILYVAPDALQMPADLEKEIADLFMLHGTSGDNRQRRIATVDDALPLTDILYMTRIQKERFTSAADIVDTSAYNLSKDKLKDHAPPGLKVLHPLPRIDEIPTEVDLDPHAAYFPQAENGLYVRMALLVLLFGKAADLWCN